MEIGLSLCESAVGQGIATEATPSPSTLGAARVEIRRDILDERGAAVARRLGYVLRDTPGGRA